MLYGTKWILVGLGFSRVITASSLVLTRGAIRATQCPWAAWNLVRAVRSVFPSKQAVMLSLSGTCMWSVCCTFSTAGLGLGDTQAICFSQEMLFPRMLASTFPNCPLLVLSYDSVQWCTSPVMLE